MSADLTGESAWIALRDTALEPRVKSEILTTPESRVEFLHGAAIMGMHGPTKFEEFNIEGHQLQVVDLLNVQTTRSVLMLPRRSFKSTTLIAMALGRAAMRARYRVAIFTASTGKAGSSRFEEDVLGPIEAIYGEDKDAYPFKVVKQAGKQAIRFPNQSFVRWVNSVADLRGEAFDWVIIDEAGEPEAKKGQQVIRAAGPTIKGRSHFAQMTVAGTAGDFRKGNLLWDWLEQGRAGDIGILEYSMDDYLTEEDTDSWEKVQPLVMASHPRAASGSLPAAEILDEFNTNTIEDFLREWGGIFQAVGGTSSLVDPEWWDAARTEGDLPVPPETFAVAFALHPGQRWASVVAAWRDEDGTGNLLVLEHRKGTDWVAQYIWELCQRYEGVYVTYDTGGSAQGVAKVEAEKLERSEPRPRLHPHDMRGIRTAAALTVDDLRAGRVRHFDQPALNDAARVAVKRKIGTDGWGIGRVLITDQISALEAASMALRLSDEIEEVQKPMILLAS